METEKDLDTLADDFKKACDRLSQYQIEIGVISVNTERKDVVRVGVTNAELMFIHENGSPAQHIPARPVLEMTINYTNESLLDRAIDKAINAYFESNFDEKEFEKELEKLCLRMEKYARKIIYSNDGRLAPNAPSVAKAKGGNHPLFDTGQLARSITCQLVKI